MSRLTRQTAALPEQERLPERILQFGDGNFLRGFADDFVDRMNREADFNSGVVIVPPASTGKTPRINRQDGLYHLFLRGRQDGRTVDERRLIGCVTRAIDVYDQWEELLALVCRKELRCVMSNTTEAGVCYVPDCRFDGAPPAAFPAKVTRLLWQRWHAGEGGLIFLPCELIADNGKTLREMVLRHAGDWALEEAFVRWVREENTFCDTLVDRIVTGYSAQLAEQLQAETGLEDALVDTAEPFGLWVIEGDDAVAREFPAERAGLPVKFVSDHHPYKEQKVRILNGGHTCMVPVAFLLGHDIVRTGMEDPAVRGFLEDVLFREVIPTLPLPQADCERFARSVEERFANPYVDHKLLDIALNSVSKWRTRVLPSLTGYLRQKGRLPVRLVFSFAALCALYTQGQRAGAAYSLRDEDAVLSFFARHREDTAAVLVRALAAREDLWGQDLTLLPGFTATAASYLDRIRRDGMAAALAACQKEAAQ